MIKKCGLPEQDIILSYIGKDYSSCLYLYVDLVKYGIDSDIIEVYIQFDGEYISSIMLKYYSCLHIYSKRNIFNAEEIITFFNGKNISMIYCAARTLDKFLPIADMLTKKNTVTYGWVAQIKKIDKEPMCLAITAKEDDFKQIVEMIYTDEDIGRSYNYDELARQLEERGKEGFSRNLVIKKNELVIAHACTNAETEKIAVVAELVVRKEFRRKGYASEIWRYICSSLLREGKEVYSFYYSDESRNLHKHIGFSEICEWGKLVFEH